MDDIHRMVLAAAAAGLVLLPSSYGAAQQPQKTDPNTAAAAAQLAEIFSQVGDQIYEECIFELSPEQVEVQQALIKAYVEKGASGAAARQLAVKQIQPPKLSSRCQRIRKQPPPAAEPWTTTLSVEAKPELQHKPKRVARKPEPKPKPAPEPRGPTIALKDRKVLPHWDCAPNVDYVTIKLGGFHRKLSGGEICKPYQDVVHAVPHSAGQFRFGYVISTGRLFVDSDKSRANGKTIAWAISGRDVCRNNPDPDCLAARGLGSLPPGEYSFSSNKKRRITWGPKTKRNVVAIYLRKLWNRDRFTRRQTKAILKRGNIAIHMRLKGEMSEACIGLEPKGWSYVASLVKQGRATGVNVYLEEPHPQIAEAPPLIKGSSFSLTSLFKY